MVIVNFIGFVVINMSVLIDVNVYWDNRIFFNNYVFYDFRMCVDKVVIFNNGGVSLKWF